MDETAFRDAFNTELTEEEEANFQLWMMEESQARGRDVSKDIFDYDLRGFFKAGETLDGRGHGVDTYKKPSHPTFSNQSMYHGAPTLDGKGVYLGGEWGHDDSVNVDTYRPHPKMFINKTHNPEFLRKYFDKYETGNKLLWDSPSKK